MTTPTASPNVLKVVSIDDLGLDIVTIPQGVLRFQEQVHREDCITVAQFP